MIRKAPRLTLFAALLLGACANADAPTSMRAATVATSAGAAASRS